MALQQLGTFPKADHTRNVIVSLKFQPYGSPELIRIKKKQFPHKNIHYAHHDTVLPSKDLISIYQQYEQRKSETKLVNPEDVSHFSSEYKRKYLLGSPDFKERLRYMEPGEFAGKRTFKEPLVNSASAMQPTDLMAPG